jgi:hypothetical protein
MSTRATRSTVVSRLAAAIMLVGLAGVIAARDLLQLYLAWEVAGLVLWFALTRGPDWQGRRSWLLLALHSPGWILLAVLLLGLGLPLVPPVGGAAPPWPLPLAVGFGVVAMARAGCWPLDAWSRLAAEASGRGGRLLLGIYCLAAPVLLGKALVAAPWDSAGTWTLTLLGTAALLGAALFGGGGQRDEGRGTRDEGQGRGSGTDGQDQGQMDKGMAWTPMLVSVHAAVAVVGFGLAPASPLAAMGAVALIISGALWLACWSFSAKSAWLNLAGGWSSLLGGSLGAWAIAQAALGLRYGVVAVAVLPAWVWLALGQGRSERDEGRGTRVKVPRPSSLVPLSLIALIGLFPQALVEWVLRPIVWAMAGGVGALRGLETQWGVGLVLRSGGEAVMAALPATGMALAVGLAWVALYWLSQLVSRLVER